MQPPDRPLVTVCLPTFDRPEMLRRSLRSVLEQSYTDLEVIVSDNASGPATAAVVAEAGDPRVVHDRLDTNIGLFGNLTRCLTLGTGAYRYVLHDDDVMLPGNLERKVAALQAAPSAAMVHSAFRNLDGDGRPVGPVLNWPRAERDVVQPGREFIRQSLTVGGMVCIASVMLRSDAVAQERFDERDGPYADLALWLRVASQHDVAFLVDPLSGYLVHAGSASSQYRTVKERRGRQVTTLQHARVTKLAHGRFVEQAELPPHEKAELWALLRRCDRRLRLRILVTGVVPVGLQPRLKRVLGFGRGSRLEHLLAVETTTVSSD